MPLSLFCFLFKLTDNKWCPTKDNKFYTHHEPSWFMARSDKHLLSLRGLPRHFLAVRDEACLPAGRQSRSLSTAQISSYKSCQFLFIDSIKSIIY